ncbi:MAG: EamA family transporter [Acidobacteria bacterium]|nr:EamA family transporter [Acidobacteriota bacterium]
MTWLPWALLSAAFAALTAVLAKLGVQGIDPNLATAIRTTVVVLFTWLVAAMTGARGIAAIPGRSWAWLLLSGIATGLSWLCYFHALRLGPASRVAPIDKLSVVLVIVFAAFFLGERITPVKAAGALLIAAGAIAIAVE